MDGESAACKPHGYYYAGNFYNYTNFTMFLRREARTLADLLELGGPEAKAHWQGQVAEASAGKLSYNPEGGGNMDKKQVFTQEAANVMQVYKLIYTIADLTDTYGIPCNEQLEEAAKRLEDTTARLRAMKSVPAPEGPPAKSLDIKKLKTQTQQQE